VVAKSAPPPNSLSSPKPVRRQIVVAERAKLNALQKTVPSPEPVSEAPPPPPPPEPEPEPEPEDPPPEPVCGHRNGFRRRRRGRRVRFLTPSLFQAL